MFPAFTYHIAYIFLVLLLTLYLYSAYKNKSIGTLSKEGNAVAFLLVLLLIAFIGTRPNSVRYFTDTANYYVYYNSFYKNTIFTFNYDTDNLIFDNLLAFWGSIDLGMPLFVFFIAIVYFGCAYVAIKRLFKNDTLAAYLVFLGAFSTFSYATNGIKAGAAASVFLLALSYRDNKFLCILLSLASIGFHHSMQLPVCALVLSFVYRNSKAYMGVWFFCILLSALDVSFFRTLFAGLTDEKGGEYLLASGSDWGGKSGFRLDFILYSAMPVLVGYWALHKKKMILSSMYICLLNVYLITNSVWMLCMHAAYTNRIAYLSWLLYPVVLIYPFLNEQWGIQKYKIFSKVMLCHLGFTLFMFFFYY